jgi:hypothetical protein
MSPRQPTKTLDWQIVTLLVGKDKLEVDALAKVIRYNDIDVVVSEESCVNCKVQTGMWQNPAKSHEVNTSNPLWATNN